MNFTAAETGTKTLAMPKQKRPTDKELDALLDPEQVRNAGTAFEEAGPDGSEWPIIVGEMWRARRAEEKALAVLLALRHCSHPEGSKCAHYRAADALLKRAGLR